MHAVAVREHSKNKRAKLLRILIAIQGSAMKGLDCWVAVPRSGSTNGRTLFADSENLNIKNWEKIALSVLPSSNHGLEMCILIFTRSAQSHENDSGYNFTARSRFSVVSG